MSRSEGALQSTCSALDVRAPRASSKGLLGAPCPGLRARGPAWGSTLFGFVGRKAQAASGNVWCTDSTTLAVFTAEAQGAARTAARRQQAAPARPRTRSHTINTRKQERAAS